MRTTSRRPTAAALHGAALGGLRWLEATSRDPARLASDHLLCFRIVERNAADPRLAARAARLYRILLASYALDLDALTRLGNRFAFIDYLCVAALREEQGNPGPEADAVRAAVRARPEEFFWRLSPREHQLANCVTLVIYYHFARLGITMSHSLDDVISVCAPVALDRSRPRSADEIGPQLYFATHWVYALSHYGATRLRRRQHRALYGFLTGILPEAVDYGDVETLAEVVSCLRLFGHRGNEPRLASAVRLLWKRQNPDGSWGSRRNHNRTHATCVAVTALPEYRLAPGRGAGGTDERLRPSS